MSPFEIKAESARTADTGYRFPVWLQIVEISNDSSVRQGHSAPAQGEGYDLMLEAMATETVAAILASPETYGF